MRQLRLGELRSQESNHEIKAISLTSAISLSVPLFRVLTQQIPWNVDAAVNIKGQKVLPVLHNDAIVFESMYQPVFVTDSNMQLCRARISLRQGPSGCLERKAPARQLLARRYERILDDVASDRRSAYGALSHGFSRHFKDAALLAVGAKEHGH